MSSNESNPPASEAFASPGPEVRSLALRIASIALEKKAKNIQIVDVTGKIDYCDILVIMSGTSDRHVAAVVQGVEGELKQEGTRPLAVEGLGTAQWVLMDYTDVVVHVFQEDARALYDLDGLWLDAKRLPVPSERPDHAGG